MDNVGFNKQVLISSSSSQGERASETRSVTIGEGIIPIDRPAIEVRRSAIPPAAEAAVPPEAIEIMVEIAAKPPLVSTLLKIFNEGIKPGGGVPGADQRRVDRVCVNVNRSEKDFAEAINSAARGALPLLLERQNDPLLPRLEERVREISRTTQQILSSTTPRAEIDQLTLRLKVLQLITRDNDEKVWDHLQARVEASALIVMTGDLLSLDSESDPGQKVELLENGKGEHWLEGTIVPTSFSYVILPDLPQYRRHEEILRSAAGKSIQIIFAPLVAGKVHYHQSRSQPISVLLNHPDYLGSLDTLWKQELRGKEVCITHVCRSSS